MAESSSALPSPSANHSDVLPPFVLRLKGGGGDGGSIPGRYDLVDIKKSIMSGNARGQYKSFDHNSMVSEKCTVDNAACDFHTFSPRFDSCPQPSIGAAEQLLNLA